MTHDLHFFANQTFFSFVKRTIESPPENKRLIREYSAVGLISLCNGVEATVNAIFLDDGRLNHYDDLRLKSKIETLADWAEIDLDWGSKPWQNLSRLILVRNWLTHFKESNQGLANTALAFVEKRPKIDPTKELQIETLAKYYKSSLSCLKLISEGLNLSEFEYGFLDTEDFSVFVLY